MAKFCGNCGYQSDDTALVCGNCGTPLEAAAPAEKKTLKLDPKMLKLGAIALAAVVVLVVIILLASGGGYKSVVDDYFDAVIEEDAQVRLELTPDWKLEQSKESTLKKAYAAEFEAVMENYEDEYGSDISISYTITDTDEYDEEDFEEFVDGIKESIENWEDYNDEDSEFDVETIDEVLEVELDVTIEGKKKEKSEIDMRFTLVKIDGDWKILYAPF